MLDDFRSIRVVGRMSTHGKSDFGEVSEWLKEQPWKGCVRLVCTAGSNPALSVVFAGEFLKFFIDRGLRDLYDR